MNKSIAKNVPANLSFIKEGDYSSLEARLTIKATEESITIIDVKTTTNNSLTALYSNGYTEWTCTLSTPTINKLSITNYFILEIINNGVAEKVEDGTIFCYDFYEEEPIHTLKVPKYIWFGQIVQSPDSVQTTVSINTFDEIFTFGYSESTDEYYIISNGYKLTEGKTILSLNLQSDTDNPISFFVVNVSSGYSISYKVYDILGNIVPYTGWLKIEVYD